MVLRAYIIGTGYHTCCSGFPEGPMKAERRDVRFDKLCSWTPRSKARGTDWNCDPCTLCHCRLLGVQAVAVPACVSMLEVLPWPGSASQPCPPTQPRLYLVDGQLLAAPSSVAVVVAGAVHILIQVLLTARLISTEGRVQSAIRERWKEREKLPKRTEGGGHMEKEARLSGINSPSLRGERGSGNQILKPFLLQKHNLAERVHWLTSYHHYTSLTIQSPPVP